MSLILRKNNLCGRIRRARKMLNLGEDDDYVAAVANANASAISAGGRTGMMAAAATAGNGNETVTSNQINKYLLDHQGHQGQSAAAAAAPTTNFFPTQNPSYAAQPASSTTSMMTGAGAFGGQASSHQQDSTSNNNAEQLLQQLLQQQVELQNQINAQMQLNAASSHSNAQAAQAQAQAQDQQPGDSDLLNLWQQISSDVGNLDSTTPGTSHGAHGAANATAVNSNQFITTPGIASFLAGNESLGAVAAATAAAPVATSGTSILQLQQQQQRQLPMATNSTQELARFLMHNAEPDSFDQVSLRNMPLSMAGASTGALGAAGASSLFGGNAGWSSANLTGGAGISSLAAQANANIMANLNMNGGSNTAAGSGGDNSSRNSAAASSLDMLNRRGGSGGF